MSGFHLSKGIVVTALDAFLVKSVGAVCSGGWVLEAVETVPGGAVACGANVGFAGSSCVDVAAAGGLLVVVDWSAPGAAAVAVIEGCGGATISGLTTASMASGPGAFGSEPEV